MGLALSNVTRPESAAPALEPVVLDGEPLRLARESGALVIARRASGEMLLAREIERAVKVDGKATAERETVLKATATLADIADAIGGGLLTP